MWNTPEKLAVIATLIAWTAIQQAAPQGLIYRTTSPSAREERTDVYKHSHVGEAKKRLWMAKVNWDERLVHLEVAGHEHLPSTSGNLPHSQQCPLYHPTDVRRNVRIRYRRRVCHICNLRTSTFLWYQDLRPEGLSVAAVYSLIFFFFALFRISPAVLLYLDLEVPWLKLEVTSKFFQLVPYLIFGWDLMLISVLVLFATWLMLGQIIQSRCLSLLYPWGLLFLYFDWMFWATLAITMHYYLWDHKGNAAIPKQIDVIFGFVYAEIIIYAVIFYVFATVMIAGVPDFIEKAGYVAETHEVITEDGYIITVHRIPGEKTDFISSTNRRPVALIQHGISGASDNWLLNDKKSFPIVLADAGFEVWLPDTRGNSYSRKHLNLSTDDPTFWNFSFHEQGIFDLAASIDYALAISGQQKLFCIGHSRGTTMAFALLSVRPQYNEKIKLMVCLAPVAYLKNSKSPALRAFFDNTDLNEIKRITKAAKLHYLPGKTKTMMRVRELFCGHGATTQQFCTRFLFLFNGYDYDLMNQSMVPVIMSHFPDGGSLKELLHYLQIAQTDKFQQYDYGKSENLKIYGQLTPPMYDLESITTPLSLHYADNDFFVSPKDLKHLVTRLRSVVGTYRVPFNKFNHIDFIWGTKAEELVYKPTILLMKKYL